MTGWSCKWEVKGHHHGGHCVSASFAVWCVQASPHADGALHPDLRPGLRHAAGGDPPGHSLQHQEVQWAGGWAGGWAGAQAALDTNCKDETVLLRCFLECFSQVSADWAKNPKKLKRNSVINLFVRHHCLFLFVFLLFLLQHASVLKVQRGGWRSPATCPTQNKKAAAESTPKAAGNCFSFAVSSPVLHKSLRKEEAGQ